MKCCCLFRFALKSCGLKKLFHFDFLPILLIDKLPKSFFFEGGGVNGVRTYSI